MDLAVVFMRVTLLGLSLVLLRLFCGLYSKLLIVAEFLLEAIFYSSTEESSEISLSLRKILFWFSIRSS